MRHVESLVSSRVMHVGRMMKNGMVHTTSVVVMVTTSFCGETGL